MTTPRLDAVSIVCDDLTATLAFYRACGLDIPDADGAPHVEADLGGFRVLFDSLDSVHGFAPEWRRPHAGSSPVVLAFRCGSPAEVDATARALQAAGGENAILAEPFDAPWGQRYACVRDPNGNQVDLYASA